MKTKSNKVNINELIPKVDELIHIIRTTKSENADNRTISTPTNKNVNIVNDKKQLGT